jgi:Fe2+ or Zn2+ uptake regulation protein
VRIEALQHDVAREKGFKVQSHKLELYGLFAACSSNKKSSKGQKSGTTIRGENKA